MTKILLADDDSNFSFVLKSELERSGYGVDLCRDGVEAVLSFIGNHYDLVMLDIVMPKLSGIDALRIMKKVRPDVKALVFTGTPVSEDNLTLQRSGAVKCFGKPFEIAALIRDIRELTVPLSRALEQHEIWKEGEI